MEKTKNMLEDGEKEKNYQMVVLEPIKKRCDNYRESVHLENCIIDINETWNIESEVGLTIIDSDINCKTGNSSSCINVKHHYELNITDSVVNGDALDVFSGPCILLQKGAT